MEILLYFVLVLALVGDVLLAILLVRSSRPQKPQGPTADDVVNAMTPVLQGETDLLAEQLRAMQGESARTTTATLLAQVIVNEGLRNVAAGADPLAIRRGIDCDISTAVSYEALAFATCFGTEDQKEGMQAFLEKRKEKHFKNK